MNYGELLNYVAPEALVTLAALGVLLIDLTTMRGAEWSSRMRTAAWLTILGCAVALGAVVLAPAQTPPDYLSGTGMLALRPLTSMVKVVILALTLCTALITLESNFTDHIGEYFALMLLATAGMLFLVSTENLLLIFVSLELLSLCLYTMTAFNKENLASAEAALKYFLFGGMCAAFLLFGLSLLYGLTAELSLPRIAAKLNGARLDPLLVVAILMVVAGFGFKVAAVPFHLWAPDAYQGAPAPSAALIASGSKVASFFILAKVMMVGLGGVTGSGDWRGFAEGWVPVLALLAALSVVIGNLAAIGQRSVRRLLAYSAVAHAGYVLVGLLANQAADGMASVLFYVTTYALTSVGAFAVVAVVEERSRDDGLSAFAGLSRREPILSFCLMIFMLSLAGIPPLAGFFGKFYLFKAALFNHGPHPLGLLWLIVLALAMSAVSLYYYLQVLKQVFVMPSPEAAPAIRAQPASKVMLVALAGSILVLGCFPNLLLEHILAAIAAGF